MITGHTVEQFLATFNPAGRLNPEEGFLYGSGEGPVRGICVCWMATWFAIEHAIAEDCNLIVCHEALTFYDYPVWAADPPGEPWAIDRARLELLDSHHISVLRVHSTVDPTHVGPALWDAISLPSPQVSWWASSCHTVEPTTVADLAVRVRKALGMSHLRVSGDLARVITEVGTAWGGGGLDRHIDDWVANLLPCGIEALIVGETSDFAQRFALESDVALIATCHSASEDLGLRRLADDLAGEFPEINVTFRPQEIPWTTL